MIMKKFQDIEDLKNKKIKEMEDLIEIKSKKEQSMTDLEKLKSEIMKNKTFLESLKKISFKEEAQRIDSPSSSTVGNEVVIQTENKNAQTPLLESQEKRIASPKPFHRAPRSPKVDKRLPDLVNHEKFDHLRHLNLSDSLKHLQKIQETNNKSFETSRYPEKTPPAQLYNNSFLVNQNKTPPLRVDQTIHQKCKEATQSIAQNNSRPHFSLHNIKNPDQQHQVPRLLTNSPTKQDKYGTNIHTFFPTLVSDGHPRETNQFNVQRPQQAPAKPVSISRVPSTEGVQIRQAEARRESGEEKNNPKPVNGGFIRQRIFKRNSFDTSG